MKETVPFEIPEDLLQARWDTGPGWRLAPGESLIWRGQPQSRFGLVWRSLPTALAGLIPLGLVLCWIWAIARGDRKLATDPEVLFMVFLMLAIGLWRSSPTFLMWVHGRKACYFLTSRRAIVCESTLFGGYRATGYGAEALARMRCEPLWSGTGDLIFEQTRSGLGFERPRGFLVIEQVRDVEALVREVLRDAKPLHRAFGPGPFNDPDFRPQVAAKPLDERRIYRLPAIRRTFPLLLLGFCAIGTSILIAGIVAMLIGADFPSRIGIANETVKGMIPLFIIGVGITALQVFYFSRVPVEIAVEKEGTIEFRSWLRTIAIRPEDIISIRAGGWNDPNRTRFRIRHKGGIMRLPNRYSDFYDFLGTLKSLNPSIEIKGF